MSCRTAFRPQVWASFPQFYGKFQDICAQPWFQLAITQIIDVTDVTLGANDHSLEPGKEQVTPLHRLFISLVLF